MTTLFITVGLPGSGKTTWAKEQTTCKRVNRDDIRAMLDNGKWSPSNEKLVTQVRDHTIITALAKHNVICDDTNLSPKVQEHLKALAQSVGAKTQIVDFTHVNVEECVKRDLLRPRSVGEKVIRDMWERYLKPDLTVSLNVRNPEAIIVDLDGTLAHMNGRGPYDFDASVLTDTLDIHVYRLIKHYKKIGVRVIICSGRDSVCREYTQQWLHTFGIEYDALFMRPQGDQRKDSVVKREILVRDIAPTWYPILVVDDRQQVVDMWREAGLICWQTAKGNF